MWLKRKKVHLVRICHQRRASQVRIGNSSDATGISTCLLTMFSLTCAPQPKHESLETIRFFFQKDQNAADEGGEEEQMGML